MPGGRASREHRQGMPVWPFHRSRADEDADGLLAAVTQVSRRPDFFGEGRVSDTLEGRFELMTLHGVLALVRLRADASIRPLAQAFTDKLFRFFDAGLREAGTADTAVPKRMNKMAGAFYGRLNAYKAALADPAALEAALAHNIWRLESHPFAPALARYVAHAAATQANAPISAMFAAEGWPPL
ncbi:MAG: ubiquinol-cytochrome C chaperone family protein [Caulobacteraceae bacterium]